MMNVGSATEYSADDTLSNESQSVYVLDKEPSLASTTSSTFHNIRWAARMEKCSRLTTQILDFGQLRTSKLSRN